MADIPKEAIRTHLLGCIQHERGHDESSAVRKVLGNVGIQPHRCEHPWIGPHTSDDWLKKAYVL